MNKILLIGCGHMGSALLTAWTKKTSNFYTVIDPKQFVKVNKSFNNKVIAYKKIEDLNNTLQFDIIIFAVKPQIANAVLKFFVPLKFKKKAVFVSIIAGKKFSFFNNYLPKKCQFIRVMPNMPSLIDEGMSCMVKNKFVTIQNKNKTSILFSKVGKFIWLKNEIDINKVTAISGSGPGYIFLYIDAFEKAALKLNLSKIDTKKLVHQTVFGSIKLLLAGNKSANELANNIAIKGGTTEAALKVFKKNNLFYKIIEKAVKAAFVRANELGK